VSLTVDFEGLAIEYDDRVLEPRAWTAMQSRWAAELLREAPPGPFVEVCCGAGQIGLLAVSMSRRPLVAVDLDPVASAYTTANASAAGLGDLVEVRTGRLQDVLRPDERFVLVVADPPWVTSDGVGRFPHDPLLAIDGGADGLEVARDLVEAAAAALVPGGSLLVQLGDADQADLLAVDPVAEGWVRGEVRTGERGVVLQLRRSPLAG